MIISYNDGGRAKAGFKRRAMDCAARAIAIATEQPYMTVYTSLNSFCKQGWVGCFNPQIHSSSSRGVRMPTLQKYMRSLGWCWAPLCGIKGLKGVTICSMTFKYSKMILSEDGHVFAVMNGVIQDVKSLPARKIRVRGYWYPGGDRI